MWLVTIDINRAKNYRGEGDEVIEHAHNHRVFDGQKKLEDLILPQRHHRPTQRSDKCNGLSIDLRHIGHHQFTFYTVFICQDSMMTSTLIVS